MNLIDVIRTIPDFPQKGIMFRDITTLMGDAKALRYTVDAIVEPFKNTQIQKIAGIEARGFILGGPSPTNWVVASCRSGRLESCRIR